MQKLQLFYILYSDKSIFLFKIFLFPKIRQKKSYMLLIIFSFWYEYNFFILNYPEWVIWPKAERPTQKIAKKTKGKTLFEYIHILFINLSAKCPCRPLGFWHIFCWPSGCRPFGPMVKMSHTLYYPILSYTLYRKILAISQT